MTSETHPSGRQNAHMMVEIHSFHGQQHTGSRVSMSIQVLHEYATDMRKIKNANAVPGESQTGFPLIL